MHRRQILLGIGYGIATRAAIAQDHAHMHADSGRSALIRTAGDCVVTGEKCLNHIHEMVVAGDASLGGCAKSVNELIAVCTALRSMAAQNAPALPKLAAVADDVCKRCEAECRKHEKTHTECKECADACAACAAECRKLTSA